MLAFMEDMRENSVRHDSMVIIKTCAKLKLTGREGNQIVMSAVE